MSTSRRRFSLGIDKPKLQSKRDVRLRRAISSYNINEKNSFLSSICHPINESEILKEFNLKMDDWVKLLSELKNSSQDDREKIRTEKYGPDERNALMSILVCHPPLEVVKLIVDLGGEEIVTEVSNCGFNAIHYACWGNASPDVIKYLVGVGGKKAVLKRSKAAGANPLHYACIRYTTDDTNSLCHIIRLLIEVGEYEIITDTDLNGEFPLQALLLRSNIPVESVITYFDQWYKLEKSGGFILNDEPDKYELNVIFEDDISDSFIDDLVESEVPANICPNQDEKQILHDASRKLNRRILKINYDTRSEILKTAFMKEYLTERFIEPLHLATLIMDLIIQALVVCCFSFFIKNTSPNRVDSTIITIILSVCTSWRLVREIMQLITSSLGNYLSNISNWFDIIQISFLISTISTNLDDHSTGSVRWVLVLATGYSWIELLFELHNFSYELALFVNGMIRVVQRLGEFVITTSIFIALFAHAYYIASKHDANFCTNPGNLTDADFYNLGGFQCTLGDSYYYSLTNLFAFEAPDSSAVPWQIPTLYLIFMAILLLNIIIAVICDTYSEVKRESEMTFWCDRLALMNELDTILSYFNKLSFYKIAQAVNRGVDETFKDERIDLSVLLPRSAWDGIQEKDRDILHWWYGKRKSGNAPSLKARLIFFLKKSIVRDIWFPSYVFENIILGQNRSYKKNITDTLRTMPYSIILLILSNIFFLIAYISGCLTLGLLWPKKMKRYLFSGNRRNKMILPEREKSNDHISEMRHEIKKMKGKLDEINEIREELKEIKILIQNRPNLIEKEEYDE